MLNVNIVLIFRSVVICEQQVKFLEKTGFQLTYTFVSCFCFIFTNQSVYHILTEEACFIITKNRFNRMFRVFNEVESHCDLWYLVCYKNPDFCRHNTAHNVLKIKVF